VIGIEGVVLSILNKLTLPSMTKPPDQRYIFVTFGVPPEIINERMNKLEKGSLSYPEVCDELEQELTESLRMLPLKEWKFIENTKRNGEVLSARISLQWDLHEGLPYFGDISPWEVIQIEPFDSTY